MGRFTKILKEKEQKAKLSKHPLKNESEEIKKDYIQALVLLANEDDNFSDEEREHIGFLLDLIGLDKNLIDEFDKFAKEASEDELFDFIERLKKLDEKIKMQIMVESCVVAFKDDNLDEAEENIIDEYLDILELQDKKDAIMFVAKALSYKDIDNAILTYLVYKDLYTQFEYMFDILEINAKKELKELYSFEWTNWDIIHGSIDGAVSTKCISTRQMAIMLNSMLLSGVIKQEESKIVSFDTVQNDKDNADEKSIQNLYSGLMFEKLGFFGISSCKVIENIEELNLQFDNNLFKYEEDVVFKGANSANVELFFNFTDKLYSEKIIDTKYSIVVANGNSSGGFKISKNSLYLPEKNIFEVCKDKEDNYKTYNYGSHIDKYSNLDYIRCSEDSRMQEFRAMKVSKEQ